jgi:hypothetical protein
MGGNRPMIPPDSITKQPPPKTSSSEGPLLTATRHVRDRGGIRSITPPRSISETEAKGYGVQNEVVASAGKSSKGVALGMGRQIAPPAGVDMSNKYGGTGMGAMPVDAGRSGQGRQARTIIPPKGSGAVSEFGSNAYDGDAYMAKFARDLNEVVKDPEPDRTNHYGLDAIKAHGVGEGVVKRDAPVAPAGRRDISPPKSISNQPSNLSVGNSQMVSIRNEKEVPGAFRSIVSKGVSPENKYGSEASTPLRAANLLQKGHETIGSPNMRQITPPPSINLTGSGTIGGDAYMEQHAHRVQELGLQTPMGGPRQATGFSIEKVEQIAEKEP